MTIKDRYYQLIDYFADGNKRSFARKVAVSPSVIENIVGSRATNPSFDVLEKTTTAFENIDARWLLTGDGEMLMKSHIATHPLQIPVQNTEALIMIRELAAENALLKRDLDELQRIIHKHE